MEILSRKWQGRWRRWSSTGFPTGGHLAFPPLQGPCLQILCGPPSTHSWRRKSGRSLYWQEQSIDQVHHLKRQTHYISSYTWKKAALIRFLWRASIWHQNNLSSDSSSCCETTTTVKQEDLKLLKLRFCTYLKKHKTHPWEKDKKPKSNWRWLVQVVQRRKTKKWRDSKTCLQKYLGKNSGQKDKRRKNIAKEHCYMAQVRHMLELH